MAWCRTIRSLVPWLIGLFLAAQLAGVVPFEYIHPTPALAHAAAHEHDHGSVGHKHHHDGTEQDGAIADQCCALHSLAGVLSLLDASIPSDLIGHPMAAELTEHISGIDAGRLDRPPKPLLSL